MQRLGQFFRTRLRPRKPTVSEERIPFERHFNAPLVITNTDWYVNERIVELPFIYAHLDPDGQGKRVLEFGCTRSHLALSLAALGYEVVGIDLRSYPFHHPNLRFLQMDILDFTDEVGFDYITAVSTIEHIGLGSYGEPPREAALAEVLAHLHTLLKSDGLFLLSTPVGRSHQDSFLRSFSWKELAALLRKSGFETAAQKFYYRDRLKFWHPCTLNDLETISNEQEQRGLTGVNGVACLALRLSDRHA